MGKRKGKAQQNLGRVEDRSLAAGLELDGGDALAAAELDEWQLGALRESSESEGEVRHPIKKRKRRRAAPAVRGGDGSIVTKAVPVEQQQWHFAELAVEWWGVVSSSCVAAQQQQHMLEDGQLLFSLQPDESNDGPEDSPRSIALRYQAGGGGGLWQGSLAAPGQSEAQALLHLLKSGNISCSIGGPLGGSGRNGSSASGSVSASTLCLSLTDKAVADAAEHPEEQLQRQWHRSLLTLLRWLLPELDPERELELGFGSCLKRGTTSTAAELLSNRLCSPGGGTVGSIVEGLASPRSPTAGAIGAPGFDASELYAAVKPTGQEPELPASATASFLLPTLRRYQARAAQWMISREQGMTTVVPMAAAASGGAGAGVKAEDGWHDREPLLHPLWRRVPCRPGTDCFYMNAYNGRISLERFEAVPEVRGGCLADEMGLGKTVELLACIVAHRYTGPSPSFEQPRRVLHRGGKRRQVVVACLCGATSEEGYQGLWLQCDKCNTWMHATCCGLRSAPQGAFVCGACQRASAAASVTQDCGATLVVCPSPILHQWRDEILRHIQPGAVKVLIYEGQPQPGADRSAKVVTAAELAAADIVLTTYDVLRRDVYRCPDDAPPGAARSLRGRKKYEVIPTPLTRLRWWRVCLDEAQMVESSTAKAAEMALKLHTVHRWCVTGTPLSRGLEDLNGLLAFLKAAPYDNRHWWLRAVQQPYEAGRHAGRARLLALLRPSLGGLLWRSSKADVAHELGLPPQHHHLKRLQMSAIERHFYRRQHDDCVGKARSALSSQLLAAATAAAAAHEGITMVEGDGRAGPASPSAAICSPSAAAAAAAQFEDRALTRREEASLLHPLLRLRQACCHPQVGGGGIKAVGGGSNVRAPMTMGEVLEVMLTKARVEAEDAQRLLLASLNGLAGLLLLQEQPADAVRVYREVLATIEANKALIRADKLQQLHTLTNLAAMLGPEGRGVEGVAPTLRDAQLEKEAQDIREGYLAESAARLTMYAAELEDVQKHVLRCKAPLLRQVSAAEVEELLAGWYMRAVALIVQHGRDHHSQRAVAERIKAQVKEETMYLRSVSQNATTIASKFRDLFGLELALKQELWELGKAQAAASEELQRLQGACLQPSPGLVELAATCGRCRQETAVAGRVCRHCKLEELFWGWEGRAYALYSKAREGAGNVTAEDAIRQAQQTALNRVGRGGLGEVAAVGLAAGASNSVAAGDGEEEGAHHLMLGAGRRGDAVSATQIVRRPGDSENVLRLLLHQLRLVKVPQEVAAEKELVVVAGKVHLELLEQYRRLYIKARALSLAQRQRLYALDELEQCTMRIKLISDNELRVRYGEEIYRIYEHEVPVRSTELSNDKARAELELRGKLGTLRYLTTVKAREAARASATAAVAAAEAELTEGLIVRGEAAQVQEGDRAGLSTAGEAGAGAGTGTPKKPGVAAAGASGSGAAVAAGNAEDDREEICPICHDHLGQEQVMLTCAHRVCCKCCLSLQERLAAGLPQASRRIDCPVCRVRVPVNELVYIDMRLAAPGQQGTRAAEESGEEHIHLKGSYGTKLEAVVSRLLWLTHQDRTNHVLVFSTWKDVLELISHALAANGLPHLYPRNSKTFEAAVAEFRRGSAAAMAAAAAPSSSGAPAAPARLQHPQVLLLLVKQGANGLNLTEAQHVMLVEPLLDPAVEAQAFGRVDRIGQMRATHVHRFMVERTIEENVYRLCQQRATARDLSAVSVKRSVGGKEHGALTVRDVAQLLRKPEDEEEAGEAEEGAGEEQAPMLSPRQRAAAAAAARAAIAVAVAAA